MASEVRTAGPPPGAALHQMIWGYMVSQAMYVTAKLGIVDVLRDGPKTPGEIADAVGAYEPALRRLLRALTTVNLLVEDEGGRLVATEEGELLRSDHPQSLRNWAIGIVAPLPWRAWSELHESIITGSPAFDLNSGAGAEVF